MPREQNERRPSKPDLPRVEVGDAERLSTRFNAIHTRWQGESPSKPPSTSGAAPRHEPLPDRTSVLVSPILKIDGATPAMPSGSSLAHDLAPHAGAAEPEPWEYEDSVVPAAAASSATVPELDDGCGTNATAAAEPDEELAQADDQQALGADEATSNAENEPRPPAELALDAEAVSAASSAHDAHAEDEERPSPKPRLRPRHDGGRASAPTRVGAGVEHDLEHDGAELARLRRPSRWRWLLAALTIGVAGVSLHRTLYVGKAPSTDTGASMIPSPAPPPPAAAPPPAPDPALPVTPAELISPPVATAATAPIPATSAKTPAATRLDGDASKAKQSRPSPAPAAPAKAKTPARKANAGVTGKAAPSKASAGATKPSVNETAPGRRKLSAKPRKPPQKKERTGIIRKSPF